jgi:hypothetical protein
MCASNDYDCGYDEVGRRNKKILPNGAVTYTPYDAASQTASIFNRQSDMTAPSCVYYEYNDDGMPTKQERRSDYDVNRHSRSCGLRRRVRYSVVGR